MEDTLRVNRDPWADWGFQQHLLFHGGSPLLIHDPGMAQPQRERKHSESPDHNLRDNNHPPLSPLAPNPLKSLSPLYLLIHNLRISVRVHHRLKERP